MSVQGASTDIAGPAGQADASGQDTAATAANDEPAATETAPSSPTPAPATTAAAPAKPAIANPEAKPSTQVSRSEEHTSELQSLMSISYAVFCLKKKRYHSHPTVHNTLT